MEETPDKRHPEDVAGSLRDLVDAAPIYHSGYQLACFVVAASGVSVDGALRQVRIEARRRYWTLSRDLRRWARDAAERREPSDAGGAAVRFAAELVEELRPRAERLRDQARELATLLAFAGGLDERLSARGGEGPESARWAAQLAHRGRLALLERLTGLGASYWSTVAASTADVRAAVAEALALPDKAVAVLEGAAGAMEPVRSILLAEVDTLPEREATDAVLRALAPRSEDFALTFPADLLPPRMLGERGRANGSAAHEDGWW